MIAGTIIRYIIKRWWFSI